MKQGRAKKNIFVCLVLLTIFFLFMFVYLNLNKEEIPANVVTQNDIKTIDLSQPEPDYRKEVSVPILMYHHIRDFNDPNDPIGTNLSVSIDSFNKQLSYLSDNGFTPVTFTELVKFPNQALPEKPIIITFDDGYDDNYQAFKILKERNMTGVFYIIYNYIGRNGHLNKEQVIEISQNNMEIGSHTMNHLDLTKITEEKIIDELAESKKLLETLVNNSVISLCYPSGKYNDIVKDVANSVGYRNSVTTQTGIARTTDDQFSLKRIRISHDESISSFANKLEIQ